MTSYTAREDYPHEPIVVKLQCLQFKMADVTNLEVIHIAYIHDWIE